MLQRVTPKPTKLRNIKLKEPKKNLIQKVLEADNHPFARLIKAVEDYTGIYDDKGVKRVVYGKQVRLEVFAMEILSKTLLKEDYDWYTQYDNCPSNGCQSDIRSVLTPKELSTNLIEVKICSVSATKQAISDTISKAFNQTEKYKEGLAPKAFVSVIVMDPEFLVDNPHGIANFCNTPLHIQENDMESKSFALFKKCGFYIVTKRVFVDSWSFDDDLWFHLPRHAVVSTKLCDIKSVLDLPKCKASITDLLRFPTVSSNNGIKNVRNVLPMHVSHKKQLFVDIWVTVLTAYKEQNPQLVINSSGIKEFIFIEDETVSEINQENGVIYQVFSTMNGALIDGQNSVDCFRKMVQFLIEEGKNPNAPAFFKTAREKMNELGVRTSNQDILNFLLKLRFNIELKRAQTVERATEFAIAQNNTIPVSENDLWLSKNNSKVQAVAYVLQEDDCVLLYPKRHTYGVLEDDVRHLECTFFANAHRVVTAIQTHKKGSSIASLVRSLSGKLTGLSAVQSLKMLFSNKNVHTVQLKSGAAGNLLDKVRSRKSELDYIKGRFEFAEEFGMYKEVAKLKEDMKELEYAYNKAKEDLESLDTVRYDVLNKKFLTNLFRTIVSIRVFVSEVESLVETKVVQVCHTLNYNTLVAYSLIGLINKYRSHNFNRGVIAEDKIKEVIINFMNNYYNLNQNFPTMNATQLVQADLKSKALHADGRLCTIEEILEGLFSV